MHETPPDIVSVSQLTRRVKGLLESEISYVWVSGEISNYRVSPTGHAYFVLKDAESQIDAVMFRGKLMYLRFEPENGLEVILHGLVTVYEKRGSYQIVCDEMQPKGLGALQLAFEKLKKRLNAEGLFEEERKKPLPVLPRRIGIVTSPTGAAIRDILNVIERRFANVHILLFPARVQGQEAAPEIAEGIKVLDAWGVDAMIVGRGGGSMEDLWPFNEEIVVRAVAEAKTPVISAVGHEVDFTLCDFAADVRAPTPSAAAELVVREQHALVDKVGQLRQRLLKSLQSGIEGLRYRLSLAQSSFVFQRPQELMRQRRQQSDELRMRLETAMTNRTVDLRRRFERATHALALLSPASQLRRTSERLAATKARLIQSADIALGRLRAQLRPLHAQLEALSPLAILGRGYALVWKQPEHALVREAGQLVSGDAVAIRLGRGGALARIETIEEEPHG